MSETLSQYKSRVSQDDEAMSRSFRHAEEVKAGRVVFVIEPPANPKGRWSVDEQSSKGRLHASGWFANEAEAEQFIIKRKLELVIK